MTLRAIDHAQTGIETCIFFCCAAAVPIYIIIRFYRLTAQDVICDGIWSFHVTFIANAPLCFLPFCDAELSHRVFIMYTCGGYMAKQVDKIFISCMDKPWAEHDWVSLCFRSFSLTL
jgi:hypothetical protein